MKIKRFDQINENKFVDSPYIHGNVVDSITDDDIKKVNRSGRKAYIVNKDYELVEVKSKSDIRKNTYNRNHNFQHVVFLSDNKIDKIQNLINNIGETEELYRKKIKLLFDYVVAFAQKDAEKDEES